MEYNSTKNIKLIYWGSYGFVFFMFLLILYKTIIASFYELDDWWFIPTMYHHFTNMSFSQLIKFLLSPQPLMYGIPCFKIYALSVLTGLGSQNYYFIFVSLIFFFSCSILLFFLIKRMNMGFRISLLSAIIFISVYVNFNSYMWPIAIQHLLVVFFILLILNLYLKIDSLINTKKYYSKIYVTTLFINLFATYFCRINLIILPIIILSHILFCSQNTKERVQKYNIWLPLFITYLFYPLLTLVYVGDNRVKFAMSILSISIPASIKILILFIFGALCLYLVKFILKLWNRKVGRMLRWFVIVSLISALLFLVYYKGIMKVIMLPYGIILPFIGTLRSFLMPFQNVLAINSSTWYYDIPLQFSIFFFILGIFFIGLFIGVFIKRERQLVLFLVWYLIILCQIRYSNMVPSRYFIYLTPIFSVIFSSGIIYVYTFFVDRIKLGTIWKEVFLVLIIIGFSVQNISAISLRMWRNKFANTFLIYDYIRTANIIKEDIKGVERGLSSQNIYISNIVAMPDKELWSFTPIDPNDYYNFRFVLTQVFNNDAMFKVNINQSSPLNDWNYRQYIVDGNRIFNERGENIDLFSKLFKEGITQIGISSKRAKDLFEAAIKERPFLVKYLLPENCDLSDLKWLCGNSDLRTWANKILYRYQSSRGTREGYEKLKTLDFLVNQEIDEYIQSLFFISYLNYLSGNIKESEYWFYQMGFLESDYNKLLSWLSQLPMIKSNRNILYFLNNFNNYLWYINITGESSKFCEFECFLFKWIFGVNINLGKPL